MTPRSIPSEVRESLFVGLRDLQACIQLLLCESLPHSPSMELCVCTGPVSTAAVWSSPLRRMPDWQEAAVWCETGPQPSGKGGGSWSLGTQAWFPAGVPGAGDWWAQRDGEQERAESHWVVNPSTSSHTANPSPAPHGVRLGRAAGQGL